MSTLRKKFAVALMLALGGTMAAHAEPRPAAKDIVIVHGALVDGSGWRAVYDILSKDGFHVTIVQEPLTSLTEDVEATKRIIGQQKGPVVLVGHSYAGSVITDAGTDPKVKTLVYVAALLSKSAPPNDAMRAPQKYFFIPSARFREVYAADVSPSDAQFMADSQQQLAEKALGTAVSVAAWRTKPSYAILTTQDHVVSPQLQRWMYQRSGAKVTEVSASHAVFISQPATVAQVIETAANQTE
jgi:pimeloyl-ACP methyl ester carboxylesterase